MSAKVQDFLKCFAGDPKAAIEVVNTRNTPDARVLGHIRGHHGKAIRNRDGAWTVTEILVLATATHMGWRKIAPAAYFSAFKVDEQGA